MPSPIDVPAIKGTDTSGEKEMSRKPSDEEPFSALAFKNYDRPFCRFVNIL